MSTRRFAVTGLLVFIMVMLVNAQTRPGSLRGTVSDAATGEAIPFANIVLINEAGEVITGSTSDIDGRYSINPINPGMYSAEASFTGYATVKVVDILVAPNSPTYQDFKLREESEMLKEVVITREAPLIEKSRSSMITTSDDIAHMAVRDISSVSSKAAGVTTRSSGYTNIRGSRSEGAVYFIDGVKVRGSVNIPQAAIAQTEVITGGLPAQFGDHVNPLHEYEILFLTPQEVRSSSPAIKKEKKKESAIQMSRVLTAGELSDFSKWVLWEDYNKTTFEEQKEHWAVKPNERYSLQVKFPGGLPVVDADVDLLNIAGDVLYSTRTDNTGKAELWLNLFESGDSVGSITVVFNESKYEVSSPKRFQEGMNIMVVDEECDIPNSVDISFVVDATGSMQDEIDYLKAELMDVITRVSASLNHSNIRLGNVFYRDAGDDYITRYSDLDGDIKKGIRFIQNQNAGGGGDYPEAVIEALEVGINELSWSEEAVSRIMFLVLDAPPHHDSTKVLHIQRLISEAAQKGIRIIPIASSGIDKSTEYILRSMALATNGTYTFLTDDSGIGNPHIKPTTDSYKVELLNDLMVRLIHQFSYVPRCEDIIENENEHLLASADSSVRTEPVPESDYANDSNSLVEIDPKDIKQILKEGYSKKFNWHYYPNPTRDIVNIEFNQKVSEVFLTDLRGKILVRKVVNGKGLLQINLDPYPVGTYFIKFIHNKRWVTERIVRVY
jgi:hypothetical protein